MVIATEVSIGHVKKDISTLVNRVAYGLERIVLTSRGRPKAAIVSIDDYERLVSQQKEQRLAQWQAWLVENKKLNDRILQKNKGQPIDVDSIWEASRADLEERHDWL